MGKQISKVVPEFNLLDIGSACGSKNMNELPRLCQAILGTNIGRTTCCQVIKNVRKLVDNCGKFPFIYCCHSGAKVLVVPGKQDVYVAYCRSPLCDIRHLRSVAEAHGLKYKEEVLEPWYELPQFKAPFVDNVLLKLEDQIENDMKQETKRISESYTQFDFDIAAYDALMSIPATDGRCSGYLKMEVAIANDESCVVRIMTKRVDNSSHGPIPPIVGLVFDNTGTQKLEQSLKSEPAKKVGALLMGDWHKLESYSFPSFGNEKWTAHANLFMSGTADPAWIARTEVAIIVGCHLGIRDAGRYLEDEFAASGSERFLQRLSQFSDVNRLPCSEEEKPIYWQQIVGDIRVVLEKTPPQDARFMLQAKYDRINKLLQFAEKYPLLTSSVEFESDDEQAGVRHLLKNHLFNGEPLLGDMSQYQLILESNIIRRDMDKNERDWEQYFERSPYATIEALFDEIEVKSVNVRSDPYRQVVKRLFEKCDEEGLREVRKYLVERVYDNITSSTTKVFGESFGSFIGGICTAASFGKVNGYSVARKLRSNRHRNDVDRFLKDISYNEKKETEEVPCGS